ncbi:MAG: serine/threonine-protein kinase PknK [Cyanobacteria bacterium J06639_14]
MTSITQTPTPEEPKLLLPGYTFIESLHRGTRTTVYRAVETATQQAVVIKVLSQEYPNFAELVQFRNQYTVAKNLSMPGIIRPLSLKPCGNGYGLVMEDVGGISLAHHVEQHSPSLVEILDIAIQLADILHELHQYRVIHKDIKPANILILPDSKQVKLIDFSIASLLPKETQTIQSPKSLEGTLAYIAPEQTGRMNRAIDYRTDFYALGVTLYQLLTGQLPFASEDPLELIHCHMAQLAVTVDQVNPEVPSMVAAIVAKLMAKNAEDRYQSALGLKHDLEQCLTQWQEQKAITDFALGQQDVCDRFLIPEKLYGREAEVKSLLDAFERVAQGSSELMLVAGFSGIGKTAVVNEVHKPITQQKGYFIKGKFDQFKRSIPFSAFVQAFRSLIEQLLSESDEELAIWKIKILKALGNNSQVLIDVIPELEWVIGQQPPAIELSATAAQNRFNLLLQKFIGIFTTSAHPLVIFLDDLQWADSASLNLIQVLMGASEIGYLLLLGAYRDNEVFSAHPLMLSLAELKKQAAIITTITLAPLSIPHVNQLTAETLSCAPEVAQPLTNLVHQKTQGNPFFTTQFLKGLHEDKLIAFNTNLKHWECDLTPVRNAALTDDVVEFMAERLQKLPAATQNILKLAACIGNLFDIATLAIVSQQSNIDVATILWRALQEGIILPQSEVYKFYIERDTEDCIQDSPLILYQFLHDRVQQAAYLLIPEQQKKITHYQTGKLLLQHTPPTKWEEKVFDIVNQLNEGITLIETEGERIKLAELNLIAGKKALAATAYAAAAKYLDFSIKCLNNDDWESHYSLILSVYETAIKAEYLNINFSYAQKLAKFVLEQTKGVLDRVRICELQIQMYMAQAEMPQALAVGISALKILDVNLNHAPKASDVRLPKLSDIESLRITAI